MAVRSPRRPAFNFMRYSASESDPWAGPEHRGGRPGDPLIARTGIVSTGTMRQADHGMVSYATMGDGQQFRRMK